MVNDEISIKMFCADCVEQSKNIKDESIDLTIIDPPYFRVVNNKWDKFKNINEYLAFSETYVKELERVMRLNGNVLIFGCSVNVNILSKLNSLMENCGFEFIQEIIIDKGMKSIAGRISNKIKMLPPVSENIFVYRKNGQSFVKDLLISKQKEFGYSTNDIKKKLGMAMNGGGNWSKYVGNTEFPLFPTEEFWNKLKELFNLDIDYTSIKQTYNGIHGLTNVWNDIEFYFKPRLHPTQKPLSLIERCVQIFSDENNIVLDLFMGSGTTAIACKNLNRRFIGIEKDKDYFDKAYLRLQSSFF